MFAQTISYKSLLLVFHSIQVIFVFHSDLFVNWSYDDHLFMLQFWFVLQQIIEEATLPAAEVEQLEGPGGTLALKACKQCECIFEWKGQAVLQNTDRSEKRLPSLALKELVVPKTYLRIFLDLLIYLFHTTNWNSKWEQTRCFL